MAEYDPFADSGIGLDGNDFFPDGGGAGRKRHSNFDEIHDPNRPKKTNDLPPNMKKPQRSQAETAELIGSVKEVRKPFSVRVCLHYLKNDCLWGDKCRFSHDPEELRKGAPATEAMTFSNLDASQLSRKVNIPRNMFDFFLTDNTKRLLTNASGVADVDWDSHTAEVILFGTASQVENAEQLLRRAITHCHWGVNAAKVRELLSAQERTAAKLLLSPMVPNLKKGSFQFSASNLQVAIGSGSSNDLVLKGPLISRSHVVLEFVPSKGSLYAIDTSTNGTFLNGVRLPAKSSGKVAMFHGDELVFPEPSKDGKVGEFGYMVNLEFV